MSNYSYFEVYTEGDSPFLIDLSKYASGRSGRHLPRTLTFSLLGYRYRPATPTCGLFPPRLIVDAQNAFDTSGQVVSNEVGSKRGGASVALNGRTSDSAASCIDSSLGAYNFIIEIKDGNSHLPSAISVSVSDCSILPNTISFDSSNVPIVSPTDLTLKTLMNSALIGKSYGSLNAVAVPIGLSSSFYTPSTGATLTTELFGVGSPDELLVSTVHHGFHALATAAPVNANSLITRTPIYFARTTTTPINWRTGGIGYAITFGKPGSTWVDDLLQKGVALSFFYRVHSVTGDFDSPLVIQRFDVLMGDVIEPPDYTVAAVDTPYPTTLVPRTYREFVSVYKVFILPNTETLITPTSTTDSLITNSVVLPIRRNEQPAFAGTFALSFDY